MQTVEFLQKVLPSTGFYVVDRLTSKGWRHQVCESVEEAAAYSEQFDSQGVPTYFGCASYRERSVDGVKDGKPVKRVRTHRNVRAIKDFWADLDVEPGNPAKFESQAAACEALAAFCSTTGLPLPMVIASGVGLHIHWILTKEIVPEVWKQTAEGLKALAAKLRFKADPACTADMARVLRPVGTWNRKDPNNPRPVELIADSEPVEYLAFDALVRAALKRHGVKPLEGIRQVEAATATLNQAFAIARNFPPCSSIKIAERCAQLGRMRDTRGNISEPAWYSGIQLLCHSVEGDAIIHEWSNGHASYSVEETNRKIAQVREQALGPTLCTTFESRNPGGCDGCTYKGNISSPAQLGTQLASPPTLLLHAPSAAGLATSDQSNASQTPATHPLIELNAQYAWVCQQKQIYRFRHADFIDPRQFKIALANRPPVIVDSGANNTKPVALAETWLRWPDRRQHQDIVYEPGQGAVFKDCVNIWRGWGCEPAEGDVNPWGQLVDAAFGSDIAARTFFEQWVAYQIQYPGKKLNVACILWSTQQGVGKTLIGETVGKIFGDNFEIITAAELNGTFNSWSRGKQFILGEENTSSDRRADADRLKHLITGERITINEKFQPAVALRNTLNFMFTSNSPNAFHLDMNDRRFFVWEFKGEKLPDDFFTEFVKWRDERGGLAALMYYLLHLPLAGFNPKAAAPMTEAKGAMIEGSRTDIERWIFDHYADPNASISSEIVFTDDLVAKYNSTHGQRAATSTSIGRALGRFGCGEKRVCMRDGQRRLLKSIRRRQHWETASVEAWVGEYLRQFPALVGTQATTVP